MSNKPQAQTAHTSRFQCNNPEIRIVKKSDGSVWFVARDVTRFLGYSNHRHPLKRYVKKKDINTQWVSFADLSGMVWETIVNESGMFSLMLGSQKPQAKRFKDWVASEILPFALKHRSQPLNGIFNSSNGNYHA